DFLYNYNRSNNLVADQEQFFVLEKQINELLALFLHHLFISYSQNKDDMIQSQKERVNGRSVPIIPLTASTSILPLIGQIDESRSAIIEEKVLAKIETDRIEMIIIDLSGVVEMMPEAIQQMMGLMDGIRMMGCQAIMTGIRPELVKVMIRLGLCFEHKAIMKGTLQQALADHLVHSASTSTNPQA